MPLKQNLPSLFFKVLIILLGSLIFTSLVGVRSWYKPLLSIKEVSPVSVVLEKDARVLDEVATNQLKEETKTKSIYNLNNQEVLTVDDTATQRSLEELKTYVKVIQATLSGQKSYEMPIINRIGIHMQMTLIQLNDHKFKEIQTVLDGNNSAGEFINSDYEKIILAISNLSSFEKNYFLKEIERFRLEFKNEKKVIKNLGANFFLDLQKITDKKEFLFRLFIIQKKLLNIGIVNGLPKSKITKNIEILFPSLRGLELDLTKKIILSTTSPNIKIDWKKVEDLENRALASVADIYVKLPTGTVLAEKGKKISEKNYYYMKNLNLLRPEADWSLEIKYLCITYTAVFLMSLYIFLIEKRKYSVQRLAMIFTVVLGSQAIISAISLWGINKLAVIPISLIPILLTVFYLPKLALFSSLLINFFLMYSFDLNFWQVLPLLAGSIYAIYLTKHSHQREDLANAGTKIALCQGLVFLFSVLIAVKNFSVSTVLVITALYALSGILSGLIALAVLPYLEFTFRLLTPFRLSELSNPNQALLKKLKEEAPGTYEHSLNVSRYAEEASNAIGANTELIRVGLLYHDIGKTYNPDYFIENNLGKPNPHTTLDDPKKSAEIIIAHVPEGIKLAKKHKLPEAIIDFIPMHQGTTVTNYFYVKALEKYGKSNINIMDFKYPGPVPNSREAGIAMIADSAEAALKSEKELNSENDVREKIAKIISARVNEGELRNSNLKLEELELIKDSFVKVWKSRNHDRIKYPEQSKPPID
ncbi:MAG: HDIG domain-containing protein [Candidatus Melainabacteria bacterium]|nr:HDIG domain-containing protein [Candidatus Melainabacteria bacterium]